MVQEIRAIVVKFFTTDGKVSVVKVGSQLVVLMALVLGLVAFVGNNKTVTLNVDGKVSSVQTFGGTVGQVVKAANVELQSADKVTPAADAHVQDGSVINVNLAKAVKVSVDGAERTVTTTAPTVESLVSELGVASASEVSVPKDAQLAVSGSYVSISTPKTVTLVADGKDTKTTTTAATVGELLNGAGIKLGASDRLSQPANAPVVNDMVVKVSRVDTTKTDETTEAVPFESLSSDDATLFKGDSKVLQAGVNGSMSKSFKLILVDGREASRTLVSQNVTLQPVTEKIAVGTKEKPKPQAAAAPAASGNTGAAAPAMMNEAMWDKIAQCESGGNWSINSGNGYYGGLQFDIPSWLANGGGAYAPNASQASKAQQIAVANTYYAKAGLGPWGCGWAASR
ncbi:MULTISPECIES: resuscitation-promoting factor [unclassified Arthrobacter]|uniref:resuscitation-promoting factor n=1 Tax=unclassified Arthrobacter TaxID=235627 RepID=UPI0025B4649C|nr:resuscitation-promoting factor [Arthrobacter sp. YD4]MDN3937478.1 transglycosylase family protein [Arthrobacter sp. YD4]